MEQPGTRNGKDSDHSAGEVVFGRSWAWAALVFPPLAMFVMPVAVVGFVVEPEWPIQIVENLLPAGAATLPEGADELRNSSAFARHINHRIVYSAAIFFHVTLCLSLILLFWDRLREFPRFLRYRAYVFMVIEALLFFALQMYYWRDTKLYNLTYTNFRDFFAKACAFHDIAPCNVEDLGTVTTKLSILAHIPQIAAIAALIVALAVAGAVVGDLQRPDQPDWRERFVAGVNNLQICFFGLSAVLVTSTIAAALFFQFPANLVVDLAAEAEGLESVATAMKEYAHALILFWGTVYTLTLFATFAPAALILRSLIRRYGRRAESEPEFRQWLASKALASPLRLITNFAVMLAPMLFGAVGTLIKFLPGGG